MQVFRFTGICAVIMGTVLTIIMMIARRTLIQVFINDTEVIAYGIQMVIALQLSGPFIGILFLCINTIQGNGKGAPVIGTYGLSPGPDFYPSCIYSGSDVRTGRRNLCDLRPIICQLYWALSFVSGCLRQWRTETAQREEF